VLVPSIRYLVTDVDQAIAFYTERLGFSLDQQMGSSFAIVERGGLSLWLAGPTSSAARAMPDGRKPEPGGWNRLVLEVGDLDSEITALKSAGVRLRNDVVTGPGGKQVLLEDPDGNPVELFQPA
jgi:catechol 2,3-dioxygenase-like lactoylglutathione lyase family enzyme